MAHLYAHFDESGKYSDHKVITLCGLVDGFKHWIGFQDEWMRLLRDTDLVEFHTARAVRYSRPYGKMQPGKATDRAKDILPFIHKITDWIEVGVAFAVDTTAYQSKRLSVLHHTFGLDPQQFLFFIVVNSLLSYFPKHLTVGLIFDDEEKSAVECYRILQKMKARNPEVRERITSICFSDDGRTPVLQASDLFAYMTRAEAERYFTGKPYPYEELFSAFKNGSPNGKHIHFDSGFYDEQELLKYQDWHIADAKRNP